MIKTLVVFSGCPGSGKSSFINALKSFIKFHSIQIDDILEEFKEFSAEIYHQSREKLLKNTEYYLSEGNLEIIIVEDTNHLKSLIKPFRRLAKKYNAKFLHVILNISLDNALERNSLRNIYIENNTIIKIHNQITSEAFFKDTRALNSELNIEFLENFINTYILQAKTLKKIESKTEDIQNFYHILDIETRKKINSLVKVYNGNKKEYSFKLLQLKKTFFQQELLINQDNVVKIQEEIYKLLELIE